MMVLENIEFPGYGLPRLLTFVDQKAENLFNHHEELQKIKNMSYKDFLKFKEQNDNEEKYRYVYDENSFFKFKKKSQEETHIK